MTIQQAKDKIRGLKWQATTDPWVDLLVVCGVEIKATTKQGRWFAYIGDGAVYYDYGRTRLEAASRVLAMYCDCEL